VVQFSKTNQATPIQTQGEVLNTQNIHLTRNKGINGKHCAKSQTRFATYDRQGESNDSIY